MVPCSTPTTLSLHPCALSFFKWGGLAAPRGPSLHPCALFSPELSAARTARDSSRRAGCSASAGRSSGRTSGLRVAQATRSVRQATPFHRVQVSGLPFGSPGLVPGAERLLLEHFLKRSKTSSLPSIFKTPENSLDKSFGCRGWSHGQRGSASLNTKFPLAMPGRQSVLASGASS